MMPPPGRGVGKEPRGSGSGDSREPCRARGPGANFIPVNREKLLAALAVLIIRCLFAFVRVEIRGLDVALKILAGGPAILCFWHNRILGIAKAFLSFYPEERKGVVVLTSPSRDGEILAATMAGLGMGAVRGSSSRRGARALRELIEVIEAGKDVAITPDGPRGPRYSLGPGVIMLAQTTGAPILPVSASFSGAKRMKTWDGFIIPLPFSRIDRKSVV